MSLRKASDLKANQDCKEKLKQIRREAYQKTKQKQKLDTVFIAMKEAQKLRRREISQQVQKRRKASERAKKAVQKEEQVLISSELLRLRDAVLMSMVISASELESRERSQ